MKTSHWLVVLVLSAVAACTSSNGPQECLTSAQCDLLPGGLCTTAPTGHQWCHYDDLGCPSQQRWSPQAGDGLAGQCVAPLDAGPADAQTIDAPQPADAAMFDAFVADAAIFDAFVTDAVVPDAMPPDAFIPDAPVVFPDAHIIDAPHPDAHIIDAPVVMPDAHVIDAPVVMPDAHIMPDARIFPDAFVADAVPPPDAFVADAVPPPDAFVADARMFDAFVADAVPLPPDAMPEILTVGHTGNGTGTITSNPAGINCGSTCMASFASTNSYTLTANPDPSVVFKGWTGHGCSGTGGCTVTAGVGTGTVSAEFDLAGQTEWLDYYGANVIITDVAATSNGVYVAGYLTGAGTYDIFGKQVTVSARGPFVTHLSATTGVADWFTQVIQRGAAGKELSPQIVASGANVVVMGGLNVNHISTLVTSPFVACLSAATGAVQWSNSYDSDTGNISGGTAFVGAVIVGSTVVIAGNAYPGNTINFGGQDLTGLYTAGLSLAAGAHLWSGSTDGSASAVSGSSFGNFVVVGDITAPGDPNPSGQLYVQSFNASSGSRVWTHQYATAGPAAVVTVDPSGNVFIGGVSNATVLNLGGEDLPGSGSYTIYLAKLNALGATQWSERFAGGTVLAIAAGSRSDIVITGAFGGSTSFGGPSILSNGGSDGYIAKYSATSGAYLWSEGYGGGESEGGARVAVDTFDETYLVGTFADVAEFPGMPPVNGTNTETFVGSFGP